MKTLLQQAWSAFASVHVRVKVLKLHQACLDITDQTRSIGAAMWLGNLRARGIGDTPCVANSEHRGAQTGGSRVGTHRELALQQ